MSEELSLKKQIDFTLGLAESAGHHKAIDWIERQWARTHPRGDWVLGSCVWCEIDFNCRREATEIDLGGGPSICDLHAWLLPEPHDESVALLRAIADGDEASVGLDGELLVEEREVLVGCGLIRGKRLTWAGRKAIEYLDREHERSAT
jgi:hypothetical protein